MNTRRQFFTISAGSMVAGTPFAARSQEKAPRITQIPELAGQLGIISASLSKHIAAKPTGDQFALLDLPRVMRDDLDLRVIDFNSANFPSFKPDYLEKLRAAVEDTGCVATNLKLNQKVDMNSADAETRAEAMRVYKQSIDAAAALGVHWARPLPRPETPDMARHVAAYRELIDYGGERGVTLLVENFGWMMDDPDSVVKLADAIGSDQVAVGPDTGNWTSNEVRYPGLEKTFPLAVTCDFKAKTMGPNGEHAAYDIRRCFEIGWEAGFRGPWCFEHGHAKRDQAFKELGMLRDWLRTWMKEKGLEAK